MIPAAHPEPLFQRLCSACIKVAHDFGSKFTLGARADGRPSAAFGPGSLCPFNRYFEGESHVRAASIEAAIDWLSGCEYVSDMDQFNECDRWQAPCEFERSRRGDCEDFALWAWRKLSEIGVDAEFYVGRVVMNDGSNDESDQDTDCDRQHAWVVYRSGLEEFLFEPAAGNMDAMVRLLSDVQDDYVPHFSVNRRFKTSAFVGCILDSDRLKRRAAASAT